MSRDVLARELAHHEALYSGAAQQLFARPAVRALRADIVARILAATGADQTSRVLSLGCGIGDTELLLAPRVGSLTGIDVSPAAIRQARADAVRAGVRNAEFFECAAGAELPRELAGKTFQAIIGVFFLHHIPDPELRPMAERIRDWLAPGGVFWGLDPSRYRLSGALGSLLIPRMMKRYQTHDERELKPREMVELFAGAGLETRARMYDFTSAPLAGLLPSSRAIYRLARALDHALIRLPLVRAVGSNFELIAAKR